SLHRAYRARKTLLGSVHTATSASFYALYYVYVTSSAATFPGRSSLHQFLATECNDGMVPWGGRYCVYCGAPMGQAAVASRRWGGWTYLTCMPCATTSLAGDAVLMYRLPNEALGLSSTL
ncbi:hypothetical protein SPRG_18076, partial [Saprolegnia parasitica CBS 223.65]